MTQLLVRNLPASVKEALRVRAAQHRRSMEAEARQILVDAVAAAQPDPVLSWLDHAETFRDEHGGVEIPAPVRASSRPVDPL
ncbi:MAG: Arc family DNA-binding protein [Micrococcales bacterium]|nr:Arc family DNA-binding protein [Micrococcales bacterium]